MFVSWEISGSGLRSGGHLDVFIDGFTPSTSVAPMFPFFETTIEWDDYGEVINPDDYIIKEEDRDQASMQVSFCGSRRSMRWFFMMYFVAIDMIIHLFNLWNFALSFSFSQMDDFLFIQRILIWGFDIRKKYIEDYF